jgi:hypothetical protein
VEAEAVTVTRAAPEMAKMGPVMQMVVERTALGNGTSDLPLPCYWYSDCEQH